MATPTNRPPRLGRGLSSLMGRPVQVLPPADAPPSPATPAPPAAPSPNAAKPPAKPTTASAAPTSDSPAASDDTGTPGTPATPGETLVYLPIKAVRPNPHQPRQHFDQDSLQRLADSIKANGLMQPIIVRPLPPAPGPTATSTADAAIRYELVAGERRWRAAQLAGLDLIPAIPRQLDDRQLAEWALIENLQREDLNAIERAEAFQRLFTHFKLPHDQIAQRVGIDRSSVSNSLRLLSLDSSVQDLIRLGTLSAGQAKALAGLPDPLQQRFLAQGAVQHDWSVRQVEQAVRHAAGQTAATLATTSPAPAPTTGRAAHLADLEQELGRQLQTKVHIRPGRRKGSGTLTIDFYSLDQFDALLARLGVRTNE